jgi:hypothetical protein
MASSDRIGILRLFPAVCAAVLGLHLAASPCLAQDGGAPNLSHTAASTNISAAIGDSLRLLMIEHGTRVIFQEKTRRELGGPFFDDYRKSIRWPRQWADTDAWWVNYIGHPIHGAAAGLIWLDHGAGHDVPFGEKAYWTSRGRAAAYSAIYSLQFEIGPLSEASIGNVGMNPATTGWVDHVVTPAGAFGLLVAEDALDRYFVQWVERHVGNRVVRATLRVAFNPSRALANAAELRAPWQRADRPLGR